MSALTAALALYAANEHAAPSVDHVDDHPQIPQTCLSPFARVEEPTPPQLPTPSTLLTLHVPSERPNEHLAVLLPKHLWKPDSLASACDNFFCRAQFSLFERRHHCRKCGGVFCHKCSERSLPLLDTRNLPFLHPPRNVSITTYESPESPIVPSRVCDDCWDQIHGCPSTPRTPDLVQSSPISMQGLSLCTDSGPSTPPSDPTMRRLRTVRSNSSLRRSTLPERSYGELDAYPLRRASLLCKATGGGRWEPKQTTVLVGYRVPVPGGKAPYEHQLEKEAELERLRKENPIIRDGGQSFTFFPLITELNLVQNSNTDSLAIQIQSSCRAAYNSQHFDLPYPYPYCCIFHHCITNHL